MGTEPVSETSYLNQLTQLMAREDYIELCRRESFKSYAVVHRCNVIIAIAQLVKWLDQKRRAESRFVEWSSKICALPITCIQCCIQWAVLQNAKLIL